MLTGCLITQGSQAITLRLLGHVSLCGVLHVVWQTPRRVEGGFMLCALFRSYLIIATPQKATGMFEALACISLENMRLEKADNGKGMAGIHPHGSVS